jgi:hypothetical protein
LLVLLGVAACGDEADRSSGDRAANEAEDNVSEPADRSTTAARGGVPGEEEAQATGGEGTTSEPVLDPKWYEDSDGNYVPNFIEVANGYDPDRNDCAPERCGTAEEGADFLTQERVALLILDSSGSMAADAGGSAGQTKMEAAKDAIARYVRVGSTVFNLGFKVYGHKGDNTEAGRAESCRDAGELLAPIGQVEPDGFQGVLDRFRPTSWTPIEGTLDEAARRLEELQQQYYELREQMHHLYNSSV